jgi:hypothetical protein
LHSFGHPLNGYVFFFRGHAQAAREEVLWGESLEGSRKNNFEGARMPIHHSDS